MTDNNLEIHNSYSYVDALKQLIVNSTQMLSEYWLTYASCFNMVPLSSLSTNYGIYYTFNRGEDDRPRNSYYNHWLRYTDAQFSKQLRSDKFLHSFRKYVEAIIVVNRYANKNARYSALSLFDDYIDNTLNNILSFVSNSSIFVSTPYEVVQENDDTRLLRYYYQTRQEKQEEEDEDEKQYLLP
jgi:hypothetical protein